MGGPRGYQHPGRAGRSGGRPGTKIAPAAAPKPPAAAASTRIDLSEVHAGRDIYIHAGERLTAADAQEQYNRHHMLAKVRHDWIKGVLEPSLYNLARIELGLETNPTAVTRPFDLLVQRPNAAPQPLPAGISISQVFEASGYGLLILGAPGAGKTTLLLELTRDLLDRAEQDDIALIPVYFNLSSWAEQQRPLADWLIDELQKRYRVPPTLSRAWVTEERILPLLDGLDEVALQQREACVAAINAFIQDHGLKLPLVVCSRVADYQALSTQLELPSAVRVQPLARDQVSEYLEQAGTKLVGVQAALHEDPTFWELLDTPLMLSVVSLAFQGRPVEAVRSTGTLEERRSHLFAAYTDAMFKRRGVGKYPREKTERWLSWLAWALQRHDQSVLYLEGLQPDWLPTHHQQQRVTLTTAILAALLFGLPFGLIGGLPGGLLDGLRDGLIGGLVGGLSVSLKSSLAGGLLIGLGAGLSLGLFFGLISAVVLGIRDGLTEGAIEIRSVPNQEIKWSALNAVISGLLFGLFFGLLFGLIFGLSEGLREGLFFGLFGGLLGGLLFGLRYGGRACLQHYALRLVLWRHDYAPLDYVRFLDYAAERIFLRKVGGGYVFVHGMLLDYFAAQDAPWKETVKPPRPGT